MRRCCRMAPRCRAVQIDPDARRDAGLRRWCDPLSPGQSNRRRTTAHRPASGATGWRDAPSMPVQPLLSPVPSRRSAPHRAMSNVRRVRSNASLAHPAGPGVRGCAGRRGRHAVPGGSTVLPAGRREPARQGPYPASYRCSPTTKAMKSSSGTTTSTDQWRSSR